MYSTLISMVDKAKRYASEPERVSLRRLEVDFQGNNDTHRVSLDGDEWSCQCEHFHTHRLCAHVMTLQRLFAPHLREELRYTEHATA
jgi:hypothetical protein